MLTAVLFAFSPLTTGSSSSTSPIFGVSSVGGSVIGTGGTAAKTGAAFQLQEAGTVAKITAYIRGYGTAKCAIYSDSYSQPNALIGGTTREASVPGTAGWVDFVYDTPVSLQAGYYWLTLIYDSGCNWFYNNGGVSAWKGVSYYNEPASSFGSHADRSDSISIYATYGSSGSSVSSGTFGVSSVGGSVIGTGGTAAKTGGYFQFNTAGTVTKITAYIRGYGNARAAIYSDLNGQPNSPIGGATQQMTVPATAGWVDFVYSTPVSLQAGYYWLTLIYDSGCSWFYSSGGVSAWNWITYSNEPVSTFGSHTDRTDAISIYATYGASDSSSGSSGSSVSSGTFGVSSVGGSVIGTGGTAAKTGAAFQLQEAGTVAKITAYIRGYGTAKCAIYSDSYSQPNALIGGTTREASVPGTAGWVDFVYDTPVSLQAGYYWLTLIYDSGCNWFYNNGGVSAWKGVSYYNEPASSFGSHADRSDSISIYATYGSSGSSVSSGTMSSSQSIQRAGIAGYMTWNGVWMDPQAFAFAKAHFDTMLLGSYQWQNYPVNAIQDFKNAGMGPLGYTRLAEVQYSPTPAYCSADWVECNTHEDWFIHDAVTGGRIWDPSVSGFLMDIGNAGFRQHWITYITNNLNIYQGFTGIFIDVTIGTMNADWVPWARFSDGSTPVFKASDLNSWHTNAVNFLAQIKAAFPTKTVIINTDGDNLDYVAKVDGVMIEGFTHATWQSADDHSTSSGAISQIDYYSTITSNGKIAWYISGASSGTTSQINNLVKYCLAGALISNNNPQSVFSFNDWFSFDGSHGYYPIMDNINLGSPTGAYYQSQGVYMRDYQSGKVLFNPTGNSYTVNLGNTYQLNGASVTNVVLSAYSGEILTK